MPEKTYKKLALVGTSPDNIEDAISHTIETAASTLSNMDWFEMTELRGTIVDGQVAELQVSLKTGFRVMRNK